MSALFAAGPLKKRGDLNVRGESELVESGQLREFKSAVYQNGGVAGKTYGIA
jgi:hypothetical protein